MSRNRLDMVDTYEQLGHDHWKALGTALGGLDVVKGVLRQTMKVTVEVVRHFTNPIIVTLSAVKEPKRLKDHQAVQLTPNAIKLFATVKELPAAPKRIFKWCGVNKSLDDDKIINELGGQKVVALDSVEELEVAIGQFVDRQPNGESGDLNNDGQANLFYVRDPEKPERDLYVIVFWHGVNWYVYCYVERSRQWSAGTRVFKQLPRRI